MRKISNTFYEGTFSEFLNKVSMRQKMLPKLKEIVRKGQKFEEEYVQYAYRGKDADLILDCMEFFYENLWSMGFRDFVWSNPKDDWENYHTILEYNGKYSEVEIVYGVGAFCIIYPIEKVPRRNKKILKLDKMTILKNMEVWYDE